MCGGEGEAVAVEDGFAAGGVGGLDHLCLLWAERDVAFGGEAAGVDGVDGDAGGFELVVDLAEGVHAFADGGRRRRARRVRWRPAWRRPARSLAAGPWAWAR